MPTREDSGRIEFVDDVIRYSSATYPGWTIPLDDLRVFGEATNQDGPFLDDYFFCFATESDGWYQASFYAEGRDEFLAVLGERLGAPLQLELVSSTDFASRILWPARFADRPMFEYREVSSKYCIGRLIGATEFGQSFSEFALAALV